MTIDEHLEGRTVGTTNVWKDDGRMTKDEHVEGRMTNDDFRMLASLRSVFYMDRNDPFVVELTIEDWF